MKRLSYLAVVIPNFYGMEGLFRYTLMLKDD